MRTQGRGIGSCCVLVIVMSTLALSGQTTTSVFAGTWKLNTAKSTYDPGPPPRSMTVRVEGRENGEAVVREQVDSQGKTTRGEFAATFDGKEYPIEGDPNRDSVSNTRIDEYSFESTFKKAGKVVVVTRTVVSRDGKVRTATTTGTNARGQQIHNVVVFDRQ